MKPSDAGRLFVRSALAVTLGFLVAAIAPAGALAEIDTQAAINAIDREICFETLWWGVSGYRLGKMGTVSLRREGDMAYAWSEDISKEFAPETAAAFFNIFHQGDLTIVGSSTLYGIETMRGNPGFEESKRLSTGAGAETFSIRVPADCTPHFAADTPKKTQSVDWVAETIAIELASFNDGAGGHYPHHLKIVIANFDVDYPVTYVLLPSSRKVFLVRMHEPSDPELDALTQKGEYLFGEVYEQENITRLSRIIRKYGITREIDLPDH